MPKQEIIKLKTVSPIHTAGLDRRSDNVKTSGIMGSIRWWYESLVRGLGGFACDPTGDDRCIFDYESYRQQGDVESGLKDVCIACRCFGCTGWSKKFKLVIASDKGIDEGLSLERAGITFELRFIILKPFVEEERWLLSRAFHLIANYGSIGGKTTVKPPKQPDFGLIELVNDIPTNKSRADVERWITDIMSNSESLRKRLAATPKEHPNLKNFFFNKGYWLDLRAMNSLVNADKTGFMKGSRGVSKKLFSFSRDGKRFWGYTTGQEMLRLVMKTLENMKVKGTKVGQEILNEL